MKSKVFEIFVVIDIEYNKLKETIMQVNNVNGANNNTPQHNSQVQQDKKTNLQKSNIFAEFLDNNNIVDETDVKYIQNGKNSSEIKNFLDVNKGKTWTESLKNELQKIISKFNMQCAGDNLKNKLDNPQNVIEDFKNEVENEYNGFVENSNEKIVNFNAKNQQENNEFIKESVNKVLNDLKNGLEGFVALDGIGTLTYDSKQNSFILEKENGNSATLDDSKLNKLINLAIDHSVKINGRSKKVTTE